MALKLFPRFDPRLAAELKGQRKAITIGLVCTAVSAVLAVSPAALIKHTIGAVSKLYDSSQHSAEVAGRMRAEGMHDLLAGCIVVVIVFGFRYWFTRGQTYYLSVATSRLAADLRLRMFRKLLRLPVSYFNERRAGAIQSVLTNDVNVYQSAVSVVRDSIDGPIKAIGALAYMIYIQWQLSLMAMLVIPVMAWFIQRNSRKMRIDQGVVQADLSDVSATTVEVLQGTRVVKAFGAEERVQSEYSDLVERSYGSQVRAAARYAALRPTVELVGAVALAAILLFCGVLALNRDLQVATIGAIIYSMDLVNQGFRNLGSVSNTVATVQAASTRIYGEVLSVPEDHETTGGKTLENPSGRIEFQDVTFCYPDGTEALTNVSFEIQPGHSLALVGPSGAGKSTISDLVLRFYDPTEGRILFDGVDIRELDVAWLRSQIGVVPQQTFLFAGSVEQNVRLGAPEASNEEYRWALETAHATEFVTDLQTRDNADLGERGVRLSGGQMQRIAIARALIRKPTILILDEATSALDATSEKAVTEALDEVMSQRTTLFIAHRLTTAARANKILVLSRGQVVEQGSHTELMAANGAYAGLFRAFSGGVLG